MNCQRLGIKVKQVVTNTVNRFTNKVEIYQRYRWDYSPLAVNSVLDMARISPQSSIADIGSGTGMLARHFLKHVNSVYAIEPNVEMRKMAEGLLGKFPQYHSVAGTAEATTLPGHSVDLIVVGRAIHWFMPEASRAEFKRVLKPGGFLAIFQVPCMDRDLLAAIRSIQVEENSWKVKDDKSSLEKVPYSYFFQGKVVSGQFPATVQETCDQFTGRLLSISSAPDESDENFEKFVSEAGRIFSQFSQNGRITIRIATEIHVGRIHLGEVLH